MSTSISNSLTSSSLMAYVQSMLARAQGDDDTSSDSTSATSSTSTASTSASTQPTAATKAAVQAAAHSHQFAAAQASLDKQQSALATDLKSAMATAGVQLSGSVSFSVSSSGELQVDGSDADKAQVDKFLAADTSNPGFTSRITSLTTAAQMLSSNIQQTASISQAARYASSPSAVLSLYQTLSQQQDTTAAAFNFSAAGSSLTYAGVVASQA